MRLKVLNCRNVFSVRVSVLGHCLLPEFSRQIYEEITVVSYLVYGSNTEVHGAGNKCLLSLLCKKVHKRTRFGERCACPFLRHIAKLRKRFGCNLVMCGLYGILTVLRRTWFWFVKVKYNSPQFEVRLVSCRTVCTQYAVYVLIQTVQPESFFKLYMSMKHREHIKDYTVLPVTRKTKWSITYMERTRNLLCIPCWTHEHLYLKAWRCIKQLAVTCWYWMLQKKKQWKHGGLLMCQKVDCVPLHLTFWSLN